ncbi:hypothetical protein ARC78_12480 [Stenotrophomonas pictorum JCM 9942]|uniref:Uncharacterized protein n=1 Tax=Stenotrophomonas pictorum JCM 9942 TaxID=1236960 RepID=A0A0R0ADR1_9GAMM|nr:hypothetical protein [Stenotrophomonas pictorum]KRG40642.1 hypothetical protein ARC78_12480 [Stenotrophomonas pictorum JCM 9942]
MNHELLWHSPCIRLEEGEGAGKAGAVNALGDLLRERNDLQPSCLTGAGRKAGAAAQRRDAVTRVHAQSTLA